MSLETNVEHIHLTNREQAVEIERLRSELRGVRIELFAVRCSRGEDVPVSKWLADTERLCMGTSE